jgi:hypothetical protein
MVIVSTAETLSQLLITATSVDDPAKFGTTMVTIPAVPAAVVPVAPAPQVQAPAAGTGTPYIITGSGTAFSATIGGTAVGTAGLPIQNAISAIRTHAAGKAATIQFGDGTAVLDIGTAVLTFNNTGGTWGLITLSGKLNSGMTSGTNIIVINDNISVTSIADLIAEGKSTRMIDFKSTGTFTVSGGTISSKSIAITNSSSGTVNVTGGTVTADWGTFVIINGSNSTGTINISGGTITSTGSTTTILLNYGDSTGTINVTGGKITTTQGSNVGINGRDGKVNISGGTVETTASSSIAVNMITTGKVTVSGTAVISSANTSSVGGTIVMKAPSSGDNTNVRLEITGGTIRNTATGSGNVIFNDSTGGINITGGTVSKAGTNGYAVNNASTGVVTIGPAATITGQRKLTP